MFKWHTVASGPITSLQIDGETVETVADFIFLGSKITADGDYSHEIKWCLLLGRKVMINLDSILKSRDVILPTKVRLVKAMVFPVVMYGCAAAVKLLQSCPTLQPYRRQPTRLPRPWDSPGKNTGVGCHFLLQCMKVKSESEVIQSCPTLSDPMDCSPPGSSVHGIFQARALEWGAIAFSSVFIDQAKNNNNNKESCGSPMCAMELSLQLTVIPLMLVCMEK